MDSKKQGQRGPDKQKRKERQNFDDAKVLALSCETLLDGIHIAGPSETAELIRYAMSK